MEELNKYLSRLSEHHDMYVKAAFFSALVYCADECLGRRSDRVSVNLGSCWMQADGAGRLWFAVSRIGCTKSRVLNAKFLLTFTSYQPCRNPLFIVLIGLR